MLRAGARVIRADLAARPLTAFLTGLVIATGAGALLLTLSVRAALDRPFDVLFRATNGPHAVVTGPAAAAERVAALPEVARAGAPRTLVQVDASAGHVSGNLVLSGLENDPGFDRPLIVSGRMPRGPGEVLVSRPLALATRVPVGRSFFAGAGTRRVRLTIVGVAATPLPEAEGWVTPAQARALAGRHDQVAIPVKLRHPHAVGAFEAAADRATGPETEIADWLGARRDATDDSRRILAMLQSSTFLALLAAGFTLATSVGGRVIGDRRRIGLLRAVGVTPSGVTVLLVADYVVLAVLAAPLGLLAGRLLAPALLNDTAQALGVPSPEAPGIGLIAGSLGVVLALVALATALPAWRAGRLAPTEALAIGRGTAAARASRLATAGRRLRLPAVVTLGAKDAFARPARAVLTIASLVLAAILVVSTMGFEATMHRIGSDEALRAQPWDLRVDTEGRAPAGLTAALRARRDVTAAARVYEYPVETPDGRVSLTARVLQPVKGTVAAFPYAIPSGRPALAAGEATLGREAFAALHVRDGDTVRLEAAGHPFTVRVTGRHVEPDFDGMALETPAAGFPRAPLRDVDDPTWALRLAPGADERAIRAAILATGPGRLTVSKPIESLRAEAAQTRPVLYGLTALLLLIGAVNLLTTLLLGVRERRRDVAVLSAVGATPRQIAGSVIAGGALLALPAVAIGLPLGAWSFLRTVAQTDPSDGPDVATLPAIPWILLALPVAILLTAAVASLAGRQAARIPAAVALRAE